MKTIRIFPRKTNATPTDENVKPVLCGIVYSLLNPNKPRVEWCTIEYMHNAWLMNWAGKGLCNNEHGENGFFLTLRAAKMYATKQGLNIGKKSKWGVSYNATYDWG